MCGVWKGSATLYPFNHPVHRAHRAGGTLQTKEMTSYSELCKHIPNVPQSEWVRYIALPAPSPLPDSTAARVAWWDAEKDDFPTLSSIAVFFV